MLKYVVIVLTLMMGASQENMAALSNDFLAERLRDGAEKLSDLLHQGREFVLDIYA